MEFFRSIIWSTGEYNKRNGQLKDVEGTSLSLVALISVFVNCYVAHNFYKLQTATCPLQLRSADVLQTIHRQLPCSTFSLHLTALFYSINFYMNIYNSLYPRTAHCGGPPLFPKSQLTATVGCVWSSLLPNLSIFFINSMNIIFCCAAFVCLLLFAQIKINRSISTEE